MTSPRAFAADIVPPIARGPMLSFWNRMWLLSFKIPVPSIMRYGYWWISPNGKSRWRIHAVCDSWLARCLQLAEAGIGPVSVREGHLKPLPPGGGGVGERGSPPNHYRLTNHRHPLSPALPREGGGSKKSRRRARCSPFPLKCT